MTKKICVLLTCHNRRDKTCSCVDSIINSVFHYNQDLQNDSIYVKAFLTDDGCTDGTVESVLKISENKLDIQIVRGDGNMYWAGGMRAAWAEAIKSNWDYFLLLNDDTALIENCFDILLATIRYSVEMHNQECLCSGITCDPCREDDISYGGHVWTNQLLGKYKSLRPIGTPQLCDMTNANIMLVPKKIVDKLGVFYEGYQHGMADFDYSIQARKLGFPVYLTGFPCGYCAYDHSSNDEILDRLCKMSLRQRRDYFRHPLHSSRDYLTFIRRNTPLRYPLVYIGRFLNLYCPDGYRFIHKLRLGV